MSEHDGRSAGPAGGHEALLARLAAMEAAAEQVGTTLDEATTCEELAGFLHRTLCDAAGVDLPGEDGGLERVAVAGAVGLLPVTMDVAPSVRALDGGHPLSEWVAVSGGARVHAVSVPLLARDRVYGAVVAVRAHGGFSDHQAASVHFAARLAAVHLSHARQLAASEDTMLHLQRALVSEPVRPHPNLEIASRYLPAGHRALVGGDWFETVRLHFGRTLLVVGDVMGHGLDAAVDMNAYRSTLRDVASTDLAPHRVLRQLDALVAEDPSRRPATCLLVRADPARGVAMFASAGHLPPAIFGVDGSAALIDVPVGPPLGTGVGGYEAVTREITPEETLLMFTDGLVERRGEDIDVSLARLAGLRLPVGSGVEALVDAVVAGLDARHAEDDVAVLAARTRRRPPPV
ncbi:GAF domain-containing SpoIIE family protein phosphatase [Streptomyces sp. NBC_01565]|uniref:PP2C family protein-serine/threonine phosphatase n=1 Tax=unclassified Streptomyces TaxID=2593676 RepID=UPI002253B7D4|nr:GAF domain-containing SpoIIE family protein phosphatase [Streptomyces sp. NBC_01565]MCX4545692.1 SpoIIE family protein phosphatase [Streptomyces sp. NBC_01565]